MSTPGPLINAATGDLVLRDEVDFNSIGMQNDGMMHIGEDAISGLSVGAVSVDRFACSTDALLNISIGYAAGAEHDLLVVSGGSALLDGFISVDLIDLGGGIFRPHIGDEFTFLTALDDVSGAFIKDQTTWVMGATYEWEVLYQPNTAVLKLVNIVPAPGSAMLLGIGGLIVGRRRRRD